MTGSLRVAVLGAGYIGTDLLYKIARSNRLECALVVGRRPGSAGLRRAERMGLAVSTDGIAALTAEPHAFDVVFDCTDAIANRAHWAALAPHGKRLINLTPGYSGHMIVPAVNGADAALHDDLNMISCGGQTVIPLLATLGRVLGRMEYVEIVTTAASASVGLGTRVNLDEYIDVTAAAAQAFAPIDRVKVMVNVSPARPPVVFRVTMFVQARRIDLATIERAVTEKEMLVRTYCRGYRISECRLRPDGALAITAEVSGGGDYLPAYAGNLEIINQAAIRAAEAMA